MGFALGDTGASTDPALMSSKPDTCKVVQLRCPPFGNHQYQGPGVFIVVEAE